MLAFRFFFALVIDIPRSCGIGGAIGQKNAR